MSKTVQRISCNAEWRKVRSIDLIKISAAYVGLSKWIISAMCYSITFQIGALHSKFSILIFNMKKIVNYPEFFVLLFFFMV